MWKRFFQMLGVPKILVPKIWKMQMLGVLKLTAKLTQILAVPKLLQILAVPKLAPEISPQNRERRNWSINLDFHCGGYAKCPDYLKEFILGFESEHGISLDPVYTGKMMLAIQTLRQRGEISEQARVVAIHTGGSQGRRSFDF